MIELNKSTLIETFVGDLHSTIGPVEEGSAMVLVLEGGRGVYRPAQGTTGGEHFVGCAVGRPTVPTIVPNFETRQVPASGPFTITTGKAINAGSKLRVTAVAVDGTRTAYTAGNPGANATEYSVAGNVITFNSAAAGKSVELAYEFAISYQEAVYRYSFDYLNAGARTNIGTQGICTTGRIYTSKFDISADWASWSVTNPIRLADNGLFTLGGNGQTVDAMVSEIPALNGGYLAITLGLKHNL